MIGLISVAVIFALADGSCNLDLCKYNSPVFEPLVLTRGLNNDLHLAVPELSRDRQKILFNLANKKVVLACSGKKNYLSVGSETLGEFAEVRCTGEMFRLNGIDYDPYIFQCKTRMEAIEVEERKSCYKGTIFRLGYKIDSKFLPLIEVCHDKKTGRTWWSKHELLGFSAKQGRDECRSNYSRPLFKNNNPALYQGMPLYASYKMKYQKDKIASLAGKRFVDETMKGTQDMFSRGHLAPSADFLLDTWKDVSYLHANVEFQWLPINSGSWQKLESDIRKISRKQGDLTIVTGTSGVLTATASSKEIEIYLGDSRTLPIPELFWKLVQNNGGACMGFISGNFVSDKQFLGCDCNAFGWRPIVKNGISIACCDYQTLKRIIPEVPDLKCKSVMRPQYNRKRRETLHTLQ